MVILREPSEKAIIRNMEEVPPMDVEVDENTAPQTVSAWREETMRKEREDEWKDCVQVINEARKRVLDIMSEAKISRQAKAGIEVEWTRVVETVERAAALTSPAERGHILFQCVDECFSATKLRDIEGVAFPGAFGRQPFGDIWSAWKTTSIFIREDLTVARKIELYRERAVVLDVEALRRILKLAYSVCTEWTEFVLATNKIAKHEPVENNNVVEFYRAAFEQLKRDLEKDSRAARKEKQGPTGYAAPEAALLLERDGPRGGLITKVVTSYGALKETLLNWATFGIWVIVFPIEVRGKKDVIEEIVGIVRSHLEGGGKVVTAWTPITAAKKDSWIAMVPLWRALDAIFIRIGGNEQVVTTASNFMKEGKVFLEAGSPESATQFYNTYPGVAAAKLLYSAITRKADQFRLPELDRSLRTTTPRRRGMLDKDTDGNGRDGGIPFKKRAL
ncbi:unnamed protein product [Heligmosomoides polygyrus]|uniref:Uncharacterized protein n=1 Tax=Heligmosomoides polygyrus TaxID=6339 RepID=A0A3P7YGA7_HELPZ|nr:unnamed protein product [Heligmosomoides polygyrus]